MSRQPAPVLPDVDDEAFRAKLAPLAQAVLPAAAPALALNPVVTSNPPRPRPQKPPRKGIEFLLPELVVTELKTRAAQRGVTATVLLMELLQQNGYPVTEADFTDLRKERR
jgi:hypothetical protein